MNVTDLINGIFECFGLFFIIPSIVSLVKSRKATGVSWLTVSFFTAWAVWNIYFYPSNGLTLSFYGSIGVGFGNLVWVILILYYRIKK